FFPHFPGTVPRSVSVFPSAETLNESLNISFPSFFQLTSRPVAPFFAIIQVHPEGQTGHSPEHPWPSKLAEQAPFSSTDVNVSHFGPEHRNYSRTDVGDVRGK